MRTKYLLLLLSLVSLTLSCEKEAAIEPKELVMPSRFVFPQGNDVWDQRIEKIYEEYNVKIIYKELSDFDVQRAWAGSMGNLMGFQIEEAKAGRDITFFLDHIFGNLTPELTRGLFKPYYYVYYHLRSNTGENSNVPMYDDFTGMDFWTSCFEGEPCFFQGWLPQGEIIFPVTRDQIIFRRGLLLRQLYSKCIEAGKLKIPFFFNESVDFDYITPIVTSEGTENEANYYKKRGFLNKMSGARVFGYEEWSEPWSPPAGIQEQFQDYINLCMYKNRAELEVYAPIAKYPLIHKYYDLTIKYFKEQYGIDFAKMTEE